jgi:hypothetical protein
MERVWGGKVVVERSSFFDSTAHHPIPPPATVGGSLLVQRSTRVSWGGDIRSGRGVGKFLGSQACIHVLPEFQCRFHLRSD